ncbi:hypothetical protein [uncultured Dokdonia sp.]|uniref:hypothetical protein n=1 Tax=uncultured Dokdonia sp. TaxID=575653 RepID=UPI002602B2FD|nr:hypothetical protein [uncultured Dokdonia sp.]
MVDELELLKKQWQKQDETLPKLSKEDIYPMLLKKSSSVVKWIFIISMIEFSFWMIISLLFRDFQFGGDLKLESENLRNFETIFLIVHIAVLLFFITKFYINFKKIASTDSARKLMKNILNTRKTVKYYIYSSMTLFVIAAIFTTALIVNSNPEAFEEINKTVLIIITAILTIMITGIFWLVYSRVYGILTKRLDRNYKELKKMEV